MAGRDPVPLRRAIGYVIQPVGPLPRHPVAQSIGTPQGPGREFVRVFVGPQRGPKRLAPVRVADIGVEASPVVSSAAG